MYIFILNFVFSLIIFASWALFLLFSDSKIESFICISFTFYASFLLAKLLQRKSLLIETIVYFSLPTIYLIVGFFSQPSFLKIFNPIAIAYIVLIVGYWFKDKLSNWYINIICIYVLFMIGYSLLPLIGQKQNDFLILQKESEIEEENLRNNLNKNKTDINKQNNYETNIFTDNFYFINHDNDTIKIPKTGKKILLETWNERCKPCRESILGLKTTYEELKDELDIYYIYTPWGNDKLNKDQIFNYDLINDKFKVLIDNKQNVKNILHTGIPQFLLFNEQGELLFKTYGYAKGERANLLKKNIIFYSSR
jgi:hypothetical protein